MITTESYEVETFVSEEQFESNEEINALQKELGLEGQEKITVDGKIIPFAEMTEEEHLVYSTLCPHSQELKEYRLSPIPLRVLQIAKLAKDTNYFEELLVWDRKSSAITLDPVLVGIKKEGYTRHFYLLARWGKELETYSICLQKALQIKKIEVIEKLREIEGKIKNRLSLLTATKELTLDFLKVPTYYD